VSESSAQFKEGNHDVVDESKMETHKVFPKIESTASSKFSKVFSENGAVVPEAEGTLQLNAGFRKRKQKSFNLKVRIVCFPVSILWFIVSYFLCDIDLFHASMMYFVCCRMMKLILVLI